MDSRIRQTPTASPAKPGGLPLTLEFDRPIDAGRDTAVDAQRLAGDEAGGGRSQIDRRADQFFDVAQPAEWRVGLLPVCHFFPRPHFLRKPGRKESRCNRIYPCTVVSPFV